MHKKFFIYPSRIWSCWQASAYQLNVKSTCFAFKTNTLPTQHAGGKELIYSFLSKEM